MAGTLRRAQSSWKVIQSIAVAPFVQVYAELGNRGEFLAFPPPTTRHARLHSGGSADRRITAHLASCEKGHRGIGRGHLLHCLSAVERSCLKTQLFMPIFVPS